MSDYQAKEYHLETKLVISEWEVVYIDNQGAYVLPGEVQKDSHGEYFAYGKDGNKYPIRRQETQRNYNSGLSIEDKRALGVRDFMGLMRVLGEMHKAIEDISNE